MEQIEELQARILAAMDRISTGVGALENAHIQAQASADTTRLAQELDEERVANAQLEERLKVLRDRMEEVEKTAGGADAATVEAMEAELQLLRNEVSNTSERDALITTRDALNSEISRLKSALEVAQNEAASAKEQCQAVEAEAARLQSELEAAIADAGENQEDTVSAVDMAALEAENQKLKADLAAAAQAQEAVQTKIAAQTTALDAARQVENAELIKLDQQLVQLKTANDQLVQSNAALRAANAEGVGDADLINAALTAEIEGLRAANATERAEMAVVIARLEPLLPPAQTLPEGEVE